MKLAIFDFDGTLILKDTLPCLGSEWVKQGKSKMRYYQIYLSLIPLLLFYKAGWTSRELMKYKAMLRFQTIFRGMTRNEIENFFRQAYGGIRAYLSPTIIEEVHRAKVEGFHLVLLSGAYTDLLQLVADEFGFETVIGAQLHYNNDYIDYSREISFVDGESKLQYIENYFAGTSIDWAKSKSFGDSYSDLPVLEMTGEAIVVNPEKQLLNLAVSRNWRIIECSI